MIPWLGDRGLPTSWPALVHETAEKVGHVASVQRAPSESANGEVLLASPYSSVVYLPLEVLRNAPRTAATDT